MEWIRIEDRTPCENQAVIGWCYDIKVGKMNRPCCIRLYYSANRGFYLNEEKYRKVTHWMEIISLPKDVDDKTIIPIWVMKKVGVPFPDVEVTED